MFDLPEDTSGLFIKPDQIADIQEKYNVSISIRIKSKQNLMACTIKGIEREASNIYKARNEILAEDDPPIIADVPPTYQLPVNKINTPELNQRPFMINSKPMSPLMASPKLWHYPQSPYQANFYSLFQQHQKSQQHPQQHPQQQPHQQHFVYSPFCLPENGHHSNFNSQFTFGSPLLPEHLTAQGSISNRNWSQGSKRTAATDINRSELQTVLSKMNSSPDSFHGTTICEKEDSQQTADYEHKRLAGFKAMQTKPTGTFRHPTSFWSGYGISHTCPAASFQSINIQVRIIKYLLFTVIIKFRYL